MNQGSHRQEGRMTFSPDAKNLYLEKSESVIQLPEWLLSRKAVESFREISSRLAIVEIAGRDSVAAVIKAVEEGPIRICSQRTLLPERNVDHYKVSRRQSAAFRTGLRISRYTIWCWWDLPDSGRH